MTINTTRLLHLFLVVAMVVGVAASRASGAPTALLSGTEPRACAGDDAADAAARLVHADAALAGVDLIAGLPAAIAVDGRITPGFSTVLLRVGRHWCSVQAFNAAAREHLADAPAATVASAFVSVAAMPYLGQVSVSDVRVSGSAVRLTTAGGRHGAISDWTVVVDAQGVQAATFTTIAWDRGVADGSVGGFEGITSLPGHSRTFTRGAKGLVRIDATVDDLLARSARERDVATARAAKMAGLAPGDELAHTFSDGYTIKVSYGMAPKTLDSGVDTGVKYADRLRRILAGVKVSYNDFLRWGVSDPFDNTSRTVGGVQTQVPDAAGYINVDSPLAATCLACAFLTDGVEVHIALLFPEIAQPYLNISYPDTEQFLNGVIGHELVHSLQGGYSNGEVTAFYDAAYVEGTARASESLHNDASHSYQTSSIMYSDTANGCEGFENGRGTWVAAQAAGPFNGHSYDSCYFWWTYFAFHGPEALVSLLEASPRVFEFATTGSSDQAFRNLRLLDLASPTGDGSLDLARWGAAVTTGSSADGFTIPAGQTGNSLDWYALLSTADRATTLQQSQTVTVADGGVRAYRVADAATITSLPGKAYVVDVVERRFALSPAAVGTALTPGQILVLMAGSGSTSGVLEAS